MQILNVHFLVDGFNDWQVDDRVECFLEYACKKIKNNFLKNASIYVTIYAL